jgi:DnaJ-class molecular chaperone
MNNNSDNLYDILQIDSTASYDAIKKAYKNLSLKYHPDKQINSNLSSEKKAEKFIRIRNAYEILSDCSKREKYDRETFKYKKISFNNLNDAFDDIKNVFLSKEYIMFINILDNKIKHTLLNNTQIEQIFLQMIHLNFIDIIHLINNFKLLDIEINLNFSLKELYNYNYQKLVYKRVTKNIFEEIIYPIDKSQNYENEGETLVINNQSHQGDLIVNININDYTYKNIDYQILNKDLYAVIKNKKINNENNIIDFTFLDDTNYKFNIKELEQINTDFGNLFCIKNMGLPYYNSDDDIIDIKICHILRGDLYLLLI